MSYASGNHPASTPVRTTLATALTAAGFVQVTANYVSQANWTIDVWKSPGSLNAAGQDWYLIVGDQISGGSRLPMFSVCEGWDDTSKTATKYVPTTNNVAPAADFSVGAGAVAPTSANLFYLQASSWTDTVGTTYKISATPDRVVVQFAATASIYLGQIDKMYSTTIDPVALVMVSLVNSSNPSVANFGGATREPGQASAGAFNFRVQLWSTWWLFNTSYMAVDNITGKALLAPVVLMCSRQTNSRRGLLKDLRSLGNVTIAISDTASEIQPDGSTRNFFAVNISGGIFAGQL